MPIPVRVAPRPPQLPTALDPGTLTAQWVSPTGHVLQLSDARPANQLFTTRSVAGLGAVPIEVIADAHPHGGTTIRHVRDEPKDIHWPLHIYGDTHLEFVHRWREVVRAFTDTKRYGPGTLQVFSPDGTGRQITAYYAEGLEGRAGEHWLSANPVVTLHCPDGYWSPVVAPKPLRWQHQEPVDFFEPFMSLSSGQVLGETMVENPGDASAWPKWTLTGPAQRFEATNLTTGARFELTYTLAADETVTIDTRRRHRVRGPAGENLVGALTWPGAAQLWPLVPRINHINLQVDGAGTGTTVELVYSPRYESY